MIAGIFAFLNMIPGLSALITSVTSAYFNSKVQLVTARIGGDTAVAKAMVSGITAEGQVRVNFLQTVSQSKFLMFIVGGFAMPIMIFFGKCVVWDTILGWGSTPPLHGQVADMTNIVLYGIFGAGSVMGIGHMYFNRNKAGE